MLCVVICDLFFAGEVLVQLSKVVKQQYFEGLDMLTTLLGKSRKNTQPVVGSALIQVMDSCKHFPAIYTDCCISVLVHVYVLCVRCV